ncbi:MAG: YebC/PmpR family DNA-binding transcriptional regulator [Acidobacteria bacterium]|nr:YebC/PmpR family DNA-binding transcriptional regulator [Acidobacteriota bacterium]MCB9377924.1 YebC/PmpR family DNA-binding transcriptional regulator [Holophagales bacterium]
MAGHSKWAQIKRKKAVTDARRGHLFTRLLREITVSARLGGGDPNGNPRLRAAIEEAKSSSVPKENIERAIQKGTGELPGEVYEEIEFEGYGPGGVAVLVQTATDNRNRTVAEIRHAFSKNGGSLGEAGCVAWQFARRSYFAIPVGALDEDALIELAVALGVEDVVSGDEVHEIYAPVESFGAILAEVERRGLELAANELVLQPSTTIELGGAAAEQALRLLDALDEHDDVQRVWSNLEADAEALASASE